MLIESITCGPFETNTYLVACPTTREALAIDAPLGCVSWYLKRCKELNGKLRMLLLTHSHFDHIADAALIKEKTGCSIYVHPKDAENLEHPGSDQLPLIFPVPAAKADVLLNEGMKIKLKELEATVIATPGHTPGGVCFYFEKQKILFSGDTLFKGTIGNLNLPTARAEQMWASLKKLSLLPKETLVYPGHGEPTTIGEERWLDRAEELFNY